MYARIFALAALFAAAIAEPEITARATAKAAQGSCTPCSPSGWKALGPPAIGSSDFTNLYTDLLTSVKGIHFKRDDVGDWRKDYLERRASTPPICCAQGSQCLLVQNLNIPMCYDKFTTNFFFPDNSYGTIATGAFTDSNGDTANLLQGNFSAGGTTGDLYATATAAKPNTATLSIPPQYTGTGIGPAIAASNLGIGYSYLLKTITGPTTLPASTVSGKVIPPKTFTGPATITVSTSTITYSTAAATATKKSAAEHVHQASALMAKTLLMVVGVSLLTVLSL